MIGKVPKAGSGFRGLINYLLHGERKDQPAGMPAPSQDHDASRVAWVELRNMLLSDPDQAPKLMRATALKSRRVKSPVYHYVISWHPSEAPSDDFMRIVADTTCKDLGLDDYQMLYVAHRDTDHHHVHIVVNRVHPETGTAWNRRQDWVRDTPHFADRNREPTIKAIAQLDALTDEILESLASSHLLNDQKDAA